MESYLIKSEQFHVGINELDHFLLSPEDGAISILSFAENACQEGGRNKFAVLETKRGVQVAQDSSSKSRMKISTGITQNCRMPSTP